MADQERQVPESVSIVAMGASAQTYIALCAQRGGRQRVSDETWAINSMGNVVMHDLLFHMDDCKIQEARADADVGGNVWGMLQWLKGHPRFFTCRVYDGYKGAMEYPLQDVINSTGSTYFNNTVSYAIAYAIHIGVKKISLWGADFSYPDIHKAEAGRGCTEFLLGIAAARGIQIEVPANGTLLDADVDPGHKPYGFCDTRDVHIEKAEGGGVKVSFTEKHQDHIPAPHAIEARYKHKQSGQVPKVA